MKHGVLGTLLYAIFFGVGFAGVADAKTPLTSLAGDYACGFDSSSDYQAPGTTSSVNVGGIFKITIGKDGMVTGGDSANTAATFSIDDGGAGPAVCTYSSVSGAINAPPFLGVLGDASLNFQPANGNSPLCPPGDGTIAFGPTTDGLKFSYTNTSGFVGQGSCQIAAAPSAQSFQCTYTAKQKGLADGAGLGWVAFFPKLNEPIFPLPHLTLINGREDFASQKCPFVASGGTILIANTGTWQMTPPVDAVPPCPATLFQNVRFTTGPKRIFITAPGISHAQCDPSDTFTNNAAKLEAMPSPLDFGARTIGAESILPLTLKNTGTEVVNLAGSFGAADPFDLPQDLLDCPPIPAGGTCTVHVPFKPTKAGRFTASLTVLSDAGSGKLKIPLKGSGTR